MKALTSTALIAGAVATVIGLAGPAAASATPIVNTSCPRSEAMHQTYDVRTGKPVICVNTGATGYKWVADATR
ncbi:hypothetical protein ACWIGI_38625 [Nocardia sp. NPDC055321]